MLAPPGSQHGPQALIFLLLRYVESINCGCLDIRDTIAASTDLICDRHYLSDLYFYYLALFCGGRSSRCRLSEEDRSQGQAQKQADFSMSSSVHSRGKHIVIADFLD